MSIREKAQANATTAVQGGVAVCCTTVHLDDADEQEVAKNKGPRTREQYIIDETATGCSMKCHCRPFPAKGQMLDEHTSYASCQENPSKLPP